MLSKISKSARAFSSVSRPRDVVIVSATRTPIGSIQGCLESLNAPQLGSIVIRSAVEKAGIAPSQVEEVYMGNCIQAGIGQAPARIATLGAGLPESTVCTTVNKLCASGMKSAMLGAQVIALGAQDVVVAGGMESMTNAPYVLPKARQGFRYGNTTLEDSVAMTLTDAYNGKPMGWCAEETAKKYNLSREDQDTYALESYRRAAEATKNGLSKWEITPVTIPSRGKEAKVITEDEEFKNLKVDKVPTLKPAFTSDPKGTVTAANSSKLSDGASALVLMSAEKAAALGLKPLARILGMADGAHAPVDFPTAPAIAIPRALKMAGLSQDKVEYYEINEAFAAVALSNMKIMNLDPARVNIYGGAVALGHPVGCSGARIITTLINVLRNQNASIGVAAICNGGGGASAVVIERLN